MMKLLPVVLTVLAIPASLWADQASVHVEPSHLHGPRTLQKQTETAVIRDYIESWKSLSAALDQNRADLLNRDFVGIAKTKIAKTLQEQAALGLRTSYQDRSHDVQVIFYSPEGLSIQLIDNVEYDQQIIEHEKVLTTQRVRARYIVILTPSESRWRVRVFQTELN